MVKTKTKTTPSPVKTKKKTTPASVSSSASSSTSTIDNGTTITTSATTQSQGSSSIPSKEEEDLLPGGSVVKQEQQAGAQHQAVQHQQAAQQRFSVYPFSSDIFFMSPSKGARDWFSLQRERFLAFEIRFVPAEYVYTASAPPTAKIAKTSSITGKVEKQSPDADDEGIKLPDKYQEPVLVLTFDSWGVQPISVQKRQLEIPFEEYSEKKGVFEVRVFLYVVSRVSLTFTYTHFLTYLPT